MSPVVSVILALLTLGYVVVGLIGFLGWRRRMRVQPIDGRLTATGSSTNAGT